MVVLDLHIVESADPADNVIVHGDHAHLQTAAELHVRLSAAQEQDICGISTNVHQKHAKVMVHLCLPGSDSGKCLGIHIDIPDHDGEGLVIVDEVDGLGSLEILGKLVPEDAVMLRGQADCEVYLRSGIVGPGVEQLPGDGKQGQDEVALILRLVSAVAQPLTGQGPEAAVVLKHLLCHRRPDRMLSQTSHKAVMSCLDVVVTMIDCNNHDDSSFSDSIGITQIRIRICKLNAYFFLYIS